MRCQNRRCRREITEADVRGREVPWSPDEPGHWDADAGCRWCLPTEDEIARAENAAFEERFSKMREGERGW